MADYANDLFESIKVMTDAAISKINFDRTEIYTIVSSVENEEYCYNVTNGTYTFKAYSNNYQEYKDGASVYVQIPQNDYSQTKFIVGEAGTKSVVATENYLSPLDNMVVFAKKDKINLGTKYNFKENDFFPYIDYSWNKNDVELEAKHFRLGIYTEIQNIGDTKFGLKVTAFNEDSQKDNNETSNEIIWSCEDMYGDYRKYYYPFPQEFLHSFSGTGFQIDLVTQEEGKDEWTKLNEKSEKPKPQISNISVFIGYSQEAFKRETLIIGSTEYLIGPKTTNPTLKAFWVRKNNLGYYHVEEDEKQFKFALGEELSLLNNFNQLPQVDWSKYENNKPNNLIPIQWIDMAEGNDINKWGKDLKELLDNKYIEYSAQETNQISFVKEKGLNEEKLLELKELKEYLNNSSNLKTQKTILTLWLTNSENYVKIYKSEQNNYKVRLQLNLTKGEVFNKPKDIKLKFAAWGLASNNIYKVDSWFEGSEASIELDETDLHYYLIINFHCNIKPGQTIPDDLIIGEDEFGEYYQFTVLKTDDEKTNSLFPIQVTMSECNFGVFSWFGGRIDEDPLRKTSSVSLNSAANTSLKWYQYNNNIKADKTTGDLDNWKRIWQTEIIEQEDPETLEKKEVEIKAVKFITPVNLQETFLTQTFKCVIEDKPNIFQKEIVYSQSVETEEENNTKQAEEGYSIELLDTSGGNYYSYDHTGNKIANNSYTGSYGLKVISNKGNTIETVRWYFPKYDSMITAKNHGSGEYKTIVTNGKEEQQEIPYWETSYLEKSSYTKTHDTYWKSYKNDKVSVSKTIQYELSQYYDPSKSNNTVICYVNNEHKLTKTFNFGTAVAQGAEYDANLTLIHTKKNENGEWVEDTDKSYEKKCWYGSEIYGNIDKNNPSEVENKDGNLWFRLNIRNRLGTIINNNNVKATWQFLHWPGKYVYKNIEGVEKTDTFVYHSEEFQPEPNDETGIYKFSIPKVFNFAKQLKPANNITAKLLDNYASYTVVKIIFKINNIVYTKYFPIPLSDNNNIWFVSAPNYITYDPTGTNPKYNESKEGIKIFYIPDKNDSIALNIENVIEDKTVKQAKVIKSPDNDGMFTNSYVLDEKTYEPTTTLKSITPPATMAVMPPERIQYRFKLSNIVKGDSLNNEAKNYHMPIIIQQDLWSSELLNKWDGSYKIDKEGKNAFFANIGAGNKNSDDNSFTGVLMGTYQGDNNAYGLYGFKDGANIFKLNNDGEFFVGNTDSFLQFKSTDSSLYVKTEKFELNATNLRLTSNLSDTDTNKIGNWILTPTKLYYPKNNSYYGTGIASVAGNDWVAFWAGYNGKQYSNPFAQYDAEKNTNWQKVTNFYVLNSGSGKIGPWNFDSTSFTSDISPTKTNDYYSALNISENGRVIQIRYADLNAPPNNIDGLTARTGFSTKGVYVGLGDDGKDTNDDDNTSATHWLKPSGYFRLGHIGTFGYGASGIKRKSDGSLVLQGRIDNDSEHIIRGSIRLGIKDTSETDEDDKSDDYLHHKSVEIVGWGGTSTGDTKKTGSEYTNLYGSIVIGIRQSYSKKWSTRLSIARGAGQLIGTWKLGNGDSITSDINKKNTITPLISDYSKLFDNLQPVTYKYNDGTSDRLHTGFIAQQVAEALEKANISTQNFAGLTIFNQGTNNEEWCLRYSEFIALNTNEIQKLKKRVNQLESEVSFLKEQLLNI